MKSLQESLFDDDLVTKELPMEKIVKHFRNKDIAKMPGNELIQQIKILWEAGKEYNSEELKKHPVDTFKNIIILRHGGQNYLDSYMFIFNKHRTPEPHGWPYSAWKVWLAMARINFRWDVREYREFDRLDNWEDKVRIMNNTWLGNTSMYCVLPENLSKELIKCIMPK